jgi:hypothetical protein
MFKLSYMDLRSDSFRKAVNKLANCNQFKDVKVSFQIGRLAKEVDTKLVASQKEWLELADPLLQRNDKGDFALDVNGFTFKDGIEKDMAEKAIEEFTKKEILFDHPRLTLKDLAPASLSPVELVALEPLLVKMEAL